MKTFKFLRITAYLLVCTFAYSSPAQAVLIDFTDDVWKAAIASGSPSTATVDGVTITGQVITYHGIEDATLTFNGSESEAAGCASGQPGNGLICDGDGIGIYNDEITEGGKQILTVTFDTAVDIKDILLLDLFGGEKSGEIAIINGDQYGPADPLTQLPGGFYSTGFSASNITQIVLEGNKDYFSDYALAGIHITPVPLPAAAFLFGTALLGLFGFRQRQR